MGELKNKELRTINNAFASLTRPVILFPGLRQKV
jgi:hypothetical protein